MRVPLSWIKEYLNTPLPPIQIAKILTMAGLEVDAIESVGQDFTNIVVGKVLTTEPHPNADKLCVASVTDGQETFQVVCGAPNCRPGIKTAFAKIGASIPEEDGKTFKIKKSKIRGVESSGMLCSGKELKLSDEDDGILEFDADTPEGADVATLFSDTIFEIGLTPNLNHCANVMGIARELHAVTETPLHHPQVAVKEAEAPSIDSQVKVTVKAEKECPRYACRLIKNVTIAPSPQWMQNRLLACGIRPINNIVDITNYVLMELGHPLHAFDFDTLKGQQIVVRHANDQEVFVTLDGKERVLYSDDLVICDEQKPVAIAGVMGGQNAEVSNQTVNVLIESAYFLPSAIRKTSKRLAMLTEASRRFERGTDPNMVLYALDRAAMLMEQIAGGAVAPGVVDLKQCDFPMKIILCRATRINSLLGMQLGIGEMESIFRRLGFHYKWDSKDTFTVTVPTFRVDVNIEVDLIEEIARIYGYDKIPLASPSYHSSTRPHAPVFLFERAVRQRLLSEGLQELLTCDLVGPSALQVINGDGPLDSLTVEVMNPTSIEQSCLRTSMLPGLLQVVKVNYDRQNTDIHGFEVGRVHFRDGEKFREEAVAGIVLSGKNVPHHWDEKPRALDFFDIKGIIENLLGEFAVSNVVYKNTQKSVFHTGRQASIFVGDLEIGSMGEIHPAIIRRLDIPQRVFFAEVDLKDLFSVGRDEHKMKPLCNFPGSERDWTLTMKEKTPVESVSSVIRNVDSTLLEDFHVLDIYRSAKLGQGIKNVTFRFVYRDKTKTIAQEAVDQEHARITDKVRSLLINLE